MLLYVVVGVTLDNSHIGVVHLYGVFTDKARAESERDRVEKSVIILDSIQVEEVEVNTGIDIDISE